MRTSHEAWKSNLQEKVEEVRTLLLRYLTNKEDPVIQDLMGKLKGLILMFGANQVPPTLKNLESQLDSFKNNKTHTGLFRNLIELYHSVPDAAAFSDSEPPSFDQIFESYKKDGELQKLVDELVSLLKQILAEADDTLSAQISRELKAILEQLQKRDKFSLYELQSWIDLAVKGLLVVTETYTHMHGLALVYEAIKVSVRVKKKLHDGYSEAQNKLIKEHSLTYMERAAEKYPEIPNEEKLKKLLPPGGPQEGNEPGNPKE